MKRVIWKAKFVASEEEARWALFGLNLAVAIIEQHHPLEAGSPVSYKVFLSPAAFVHIMYRQLGLRISQPKEAICFFQKSELEGVLKKLEEILGDTVKLEHD